MAECKTCSKCQTELPANAPAGVCPKCLLQAGLGEPAGGDDLRNQPTLAGSVIQPTFVGPEAQPASSVKVRYFGEYEFAQRDRAGRHGSGLPGAACAAQPSRGAQEDSSLQP